MDQDTYLYVIEDITGVYPSKIVMDELDNAFVQEDSVGSDAIEQHQVVGTTESVVGTTQAQDNKVGIVITTIYGQLNEMVVSLSEGMSKDGYGMLITDPYIDNSYLSDKEGGSNFQAGIGMIQPASPQTSQGIVMTQKLSGKVELHSRSVVVLGNVSTHNLHCNVDKEEYISKAERKLNMSWKVGGTLGTKYAVTYDSDGENASTNHPSKDELIELWFAMKPLGISKLKLLDQLSHIIFVQTVVENEKGKTLVEYHRSEEAQDLTENLGGDWPSLQVRCCMYLQTGGFRRVMNNWLFFEDTCLMNLARGVGIMIIRGNLEFRASRIETSRKYVVELPSRPRLESANNEHVGAINCSIRYVNEMEVRLWSQSLPTNRESRIIVIIMVQAFTPMMNYLRSGGALYSSSMIRSDRNVPMHQLWSYQQVTELYELGWEAKRQSAIVQQELLNNLTESQLFVVLHLVMIIRRPQEKEILVRPVLEQGLEVQGSRGGVAIKQQPVVVATNDSFQVECCTVIVRVDLGCGERYMLMIINRHGQDESLWNKGLATNDGCKTCSIGGPMENSNNPGVIVEYADAGPRKDQEDGHCGMQGRQADTLALPAKLQRRQRSLTIGR